MGKALFGSMYVHPPLTDAEAGELEALDLGATSVAVHGERDRMTTWPSFDEGERDLRRLLETLSSWDKRVYMNAFHYSDSGEGGVCEEWLVIDDWISSYCHEPVPDRLSPWLMGLPPEVHCPVPVDAVQRLVAHALRITELEGETLVEELRSLGESVPDEEHGFRMSALLRAIPCRGHESYTAHWLEWRVRHGMLGLLMARIAFPERLEVSKISFEDRDILTPWVRDNAPWIAGDLPRLLSAAATLQRRRALGDLLDLAGELSVFPPADQGVMDVVLERAAEEYEPGFGFLIRAYGLAGVAKFLPELVAGMRGYSGEADVRSMVEWHALMCREEQGEAFAESLAREPELAALAVAGEAQ